VTASRTRRYCLMDIHPDRRDAAQQHRQSRRKARPAQRWRGWRRRAEMAQAGMAVALRSAPQRSWRGMARRARRIGRLARTAASKQGTRATPDQRWRYSRACTHARSGSISDGKTRTGGGKELEASEDRSEAERGGCDRRGFYARCPCIGMKETERCGTTLLSSAYYPFSICSALHTLFQMFSLIFCSTASALWLVQQASGRWPLVVSSHRAEEHVVHTTGFRHTNTAAEQDPLM
jgi:hypothetical protein